MSSGSSPLTIRSLIPSARGAALELMPPHLMPTTLDVGAEPEELLLVAVLGRRLLGGGGAGSLPTSPP
jgi:hypothetical protein